ncbi:cofactor assembly of complex C subunit B [Trichocoleus sp. FACHB-591]|uniref:cofactor assembly of complex C subunit B n=1 Tax=Trichocoleus sp. FACHB-591 TaxID=2692872 RepID=UPI001688BF85|nr:cofactor assembly of complex C subunit B [Trichocoleus sp. FACHB-591]MBD2097891.1 cofactor assembly of complex C subunit B [Trichocoleus sp. FACHB-591]
MNAAILPSIFVMTLLMVVGLMFFIRASVKDRTRAVQLIAEQAEESLLNRVQQYFDQRAYKVAALDPAQNQVTFQGVVRPSWFLAVFLTILAAAGILCLALVLSMLLPGLTQILLGTVLMAPLAGFFYWQKAKRPEQVSLKIEPLESEESQSWSRVTVTAHRDELAELQRALNLRACD